jgi:hypothetical protein
MTVLVTLEHARLDDVVTVSRNAAAVGESSIYLKKGDRLTVRELVEAALVQSANDAAVALAEHVGGTQTGFVAMMNAEAERLGLHGHALREPGRARRGGHYSSARRRHPARADRDEERGDPLRWSTTARRRSPGGRRLTTWNDLLSSYPGVFASRRATRADAGWSEVAAARSHGVTVYATLPRRRDARRAGTPISPPCSRGG